MKGRFVKLWQRIRAKAEPENEFAKLSESYSEPHRFYHNLAHIQSCLSELDSARQLIQQPDLVEFAIWYHDAIYEPLAKDNEEKSAQLAYDACLTAQIPEEFAKGARELILATKHNAIPEGLDARILTDIDLSILGKAPQEFDEYERNIQKEYSQVPEEKFREGRSTILQIFLYRAENSTLYSTDFFKNIYEAQARKNLQRSIDALG